MRVVGYIREMADPEEGLPAFAQHEELRRHASVEGHHLVAVCSDSRTPGVSLAREGYRSLLGVIAAGSAEGVLLPGLETLSSDTVVQEIMLWDLRARGVTVLSTRGNDMRMLGDREPGPSRMFIRDVLARVADYGSFVRAGPLAPPQPPPMADSAPVNEVDDDVVVQLIRHERATTDPDDGSGSAAAGSGER